MEILPFQHEHIDDAARLFSAGVRRLRADVPVLPERMTDPAAVTGSLEWLMGQCGGVAAFAGGRMVGYLGWMLLDGFRGTQRRAAFSPEWGHACAEGENTTAIYRALYRAAAARWLEAGAQVHCVSLLASERAALETWFWGGFGLAVVDGVRPMTPIRADAALPAGVEVRKAGPADIETLVMLEAEHWRHYPEPPTLMMPQQPDDAAAFAALLEAPSASAWLAFRDGQPAGYMRFEAEIDGSAQVIRGEGVAGITGAYVRPGMRGGGLATLLLDAAIRDYAAQGYTCCAVDFESFNPEAAAFWPRYFSLVTHSLFRVPEREV